MKINKNFYDLEVLLSIPIDDVCRNLGLNIKTKGSRTWVKIRDEEEASALLDPKRNSFYDFGTQEHGNSIDLISSIYSLSKKDSIEYLARMYNIQPINPRKGLNDNELNLWEYSQIGIQGDMVSKNIDFDYELSIKEMFAIADKYSMSVNDLRKNSIEDYEDIIIKKRALPYLQQLRNMYFLNIWNQYLILKNLNSLSMFDVVCSTPEFTDLYDHIKLVEKIFNRAVVGTHIKKCKEKDYSPETILNEILDSRLKIELGPYNFKQMKLLSEKEGSPVKYSVVDYSKYIENKPTELLHSAFLDVEKVIIGYLEKDEAQIVKFFGLPDVKKQKTENSFNNMIENAENRKNKTIDNRNTESLTK